jgi:hypothetical protein
VDGLVICSDSATRGVCLLREVLRFVAQMLRHAHSDVIGRAQRQLNADRFRPLRSGRSASSLTNALLIQKIAPPFLLAFQISQNQCQIACPKPARRGEWRANAFRFGATRCSSLARLRVRPRKDKRGVDLSFSIAMQSGCGGSNASANATDHRSPLARLWSRYLASAAHSHVPFR